MEGESGEGRSVSTGMKPYLLKWSLEMKGKGDVTLNSPFVKWGWWHLPPLPQRNLMALNSYYNLLIFMAKILRRVGSRGKHWLSFSTKVRALSFSSSLDMLEMSCYFIVSLLCSRERAAGHLFVCVHVCGGLFGSRRGEACFNFILL